MKLHLSEDFETVAVPVLLVDDVAPNVEQQKQGTLHHDRIAHALEQGLMLWCPPVPKLLHPSPYADVGEVEAKVDEVGGLNLALLAEGGGNIAALFHPFSLRDER